MKETSCNCSEPIIKANFKLLEYSDKYVLIADNSALSGTMSITNDAEAVVRNLHKRLNLTNKDLYYVDTDGRVDLLVHDNAGTFIGFIAGYNTIEEFYKKIKNT